MFTAPYSKYKLLISINHSFFKFFQKFKKDQNLNFVSFILLIKLKCNRGHIYGLNLVLANIVKKFKIHYMVICYFTKIVLTQRERSLMVIFQLDVVQNQPNKLLQKSMNEKSSPYVAQVRVLSFICHKLALAATRG